MRSLVLLQVLHISTTAQKLYLFIRGWSFSHTSGCVRHLELIQYSIISDIGFGHQVGLLDKQNQYLQPYEEIENFHGDTLTSSCFCCGCVYQRDFLGNRIVFTCVPSWPAIMRNVQHFIMPESCISVVCWPVSHNWRASSFNIAHLLLQPKVFTHPTYSAAGPVLFVLCRAGKVFIRPIWNSCLLGNYCSKLVWLSPNSKLQ